MELCFSNVGAYYSDRQNRGGINYISSGETKKITKEIDSIRISRRFSGSFEPFFQMTSTKTEVRLLLQSKSNTQDTGSTGKTHADTGGSGTTGRGGAGAGSLGARAASGSGLSKLGGDPALQAGGEAADPGAGGLEGSEDAQDLGGVGDGGQLLLDGAGEPRGESGSDAEDRLLGRGSKGHGRSRSRAGAGGSGGSGGRRAGGGAGGNGQAGEEGGDEGSLELHCGWNGRVDWRYQKDAFEYNVWKREEVRRELGRI